MKRYYLTGFFISLFLFAKSQNIGVNTPLPQTVLDVNGSFALRESELVLDNGDNYVAATADFSFFRLTGPTAPFTITAIANGVDGKIITLYNSTHYKMTIKNLNGASPPSDQIKTLTNASIVFPAANSSVTLQYSGIESKWLVISSQNQPLNQLVIPVLSTDTLNISATSPATLIPGLTTSVNIPVGYVAYISTMGGMQVSSTTATTYAIADISIRIDSLPLAGCTRRLSAFNNAQTATVGNGFSAVTNWSMNATASLAAGIHTVSVYATGAGGSTNNVGWVSGVSASPLQGSLNVVLIRQ